MLRYAGLIADGFIQTRLPDLGKHAIPITISLVGRKGVQEEEEEEEEREGEKNNCVLCAAMNEVLAISGHGNGIIVRPTDHAR